MPVACRTPLEALQQLAQVFHAACQPVELGDDYGLYVLAVHQLKQTFHAGPLQTLRRLAYGASFMPGKARLWSDKQLFYTGTWNLDLAPDGKRFVVFSLPEATGNAKGSVHVTMLLNFFDELRRRLP